MISENNEKAQYLDSERTEPCEIVVFLEKRMKSDRYWITVSCQDFEQEFFDVMKELGMKELEPEKDFRLKL
ncbi:MAG: hypothetical protein WBB73_10915, partial [Candidatus Aminicenantaceae bacterium]